MPDPSSRLAKLAHKSRQSVEYRIGRLVERGIITSFNTSINPHRMGYKLYKIYLQLRNIQEEKQRLFEYLRGSGIVYWMGECDGAWDLIFGVFAESDYEFYVLKNELISEFGKIIVKNFYDLLVDVKQYPKMYFTGELHEPVMFGGEVVENRLDGLDHGILGEVVNNARISLTELASRAGSNPATVAARMRRMEQAGVIIQYRIGVDLNALGLEHYKAIIHLERYTGKRTRKGFWPTCQGFPCIGYLYPTANRHALIVRNFYVNPSGEYADVPWTEPDDRGYSTQACSVNSRWGEFSEMEYHVPAIGGDTGLDQTEDRSQLWAFRGSKEDIQKIARALLSNEI